MESYKCKFCFKSFVNRRALSGHMRSHMPTLHKFNIQEQEEEDMPSQLSNESASDTSTEEDLAFCLMMLSRDKWKKKKNNKTSSNKEASERYKIKATTTIKGRYTCEACGKVFKSYQALGGHRASHKKKRVSNKTEYSNVVVVAEKRIHECTICLRVFTSGQALGGHKRSHGVGNLHDQVRRTESVKEKMIDLNLPAPNEEDEVSVVFQ